MVTLLAVVNCIKRKVKATIIQVTEKRKALAIITENEANGGERRVKILIMRRERERRKGNCIFTF